MALPELGASYHGLGSAGGQGGSGHPMSLAHDPLLEKLKGELMDTSLLSTGALLSSCLFLGLHYGFTALCEALFAPEAWESGVTFRGDEC